nr:DUF6512 family protein [uncultured Acetatifactor sp.]
MRLLKHYTIIGVLFVLVAGTLAHFLYDWTGRNPVAGLFAPVSESIWEHMKLIFFPMALYSLVMIVRFRGSFPCIVPSLGFGILVGTLLVPVFYYAYTFVLGRDFFVLDIADFLLSTLAAFLLAYRFTLSCRLKGCAPLLWGLVGVLFVCFIVFAYHPPDGAIFAAPGRQSSSSAPPKTERIC